MATLGLLGRRRPSRGSSRAAGRHSPRGERGGATLVGLALAGVVLLTGVVAVDVGALAAARAAAQTAADLAALAALTPGAGSALERSAGIASANGADLVACDCTADEAVVTVRRRVVLLPAGTSVDVTARARAVLAAPDPGDGRVRPPGQARNKRMEGSHDR
jgi:secretion/DNA translocation related TadE-like protein